MPPGQEGKIELAVEHTEGMQGEIAKSASVVTNDPKNRNLNLQLRARFKADSTPIGTPPAPLKPSSAFNVEPADKWITSVLSGGIAANSFYLVNTQTNPVHAKSVVVGGTDFTTKLEPIQDGRRYELKVASNPALKPGHYTQTIRIMTDNPAAPETSIDLDLTVYPHVFVSPTSIVMPRLPSTSDLSAINWPVIYVRKLRGNGLMIKSFSTTLPFIKLDLVTETEGQVYKIRMTLDSTKIKPGEFKGKVRIETNDPEGSVLEVPIQGSFS